jgi:hypothetical protein
MGECGAGFGKIGAREHLASSVDLLGLVTMVMTLLNLTLYGTNGRSSAAIAGPT